MARGKKSAGAAGSSNAPSASASKPSSKGSSDLEQDGDLQAAIERQPGSSQSSGLAVAATSSGMTDADADNHQQDVEQRTADLASRQAGVATFRARTTTERSLEVPDTADAASSSEDAKRRDAHLDGNLLRSPSSSPNFRRRRRTESQKTQTTRQDGGGPSSATDASSTRRPGSSSSRGVPEGQARIADGGDDDASADGEHTSSEPEAEAKDGAEDDMEDGAGDENVKQGGEEELEAIEERDADTPGPLAADGQGEDTSASMTSLKKAAAHHAAPQESGRKDEVEESSDAGTSSQTGEDDDEEDEPTLKYSRLRGSVPDILKKDSASAFAASERFLALGTHGGSVYVLDEQGNLTKGFRTHSASVLALAIDPTGEFIGSAGMDGIVSVASLSSSEAYTFDFKRVMRSISLEPAFGRRSTRAFVCGGMAGQLVLREKTWFGHREQVLHEGEGPIWATQWRGNYLAWTNDRGVRVMDMASRRRLAFISPPDDAPRADLFRCTLMWQDEATLLVAWGDCIKIAKVRQKQDGKTGGALLPTSGKTSVEVVSILQLDCMVSGLALRGSDLLVLAYITEDDYDDTSSIVDERDAQKRKDGQRPELRLVSREGDEISSDVLSLQSFARFQCNDYLLVPSTMAVKSAAQAIANGQDAESARAEAKHNFFYVVSPKDVVIARSRDHKDHIDWLIEHQKFAEALRDVEKLGTAKAQELGFDADTIGQQYLSYLIHDRHDWSKASSVASKILKENATAWENFILAAADQDALTQIAKAIPTAEPRLSTATYDLILANFLRYDPAMLLKLIHDWPVEIYSTQAVIIALEDRLARLKELKPAGEMTAPSDKPIQDVTDRAVMECLAQLFLITRQPGRALPYFMRLRKAEVFDLIREHSLFTVVQDQALLLLEFEQDLIAKEQGSVGAAAKDNRPVQAIQLLVDHIHSIPIHRVVPQLQSQSRLLFFYLDEIFSRDPQLVSPYADTQIALYAEFEPSKLMAYLRTMSSYYSFEKAYQVCKARDYVPEMVFLLSRIGDSKTALMLIIERLGDVERAITFVKEEKDPELWDDLVKYSEDKPSFIRGLLENVGGEVDAAKLIRRIKNGLKIEGLRGALVKILSDFTLQISLLEGCLVILNSDGRTLSQALHKRQTQGLHCGIETMCCSCGQNAALPPPSSEVKALGAEGKHDAVSVQNEKGDNVIIFLCGHAHHLLCLIANPSSIPKKPASTNEGKANSTGDDDNDDDALCLNMTTTRALATGQLHAAGTYGPQMRAAQTQRAFQLKQRYMARLRVVLKRGCPLCQAEREQFRI